MFYIRFGSRALLEENSVQLDTISVYNIFVYISNAYISRIYSKNPCEPNPAFRMKLIIINNAAR